MAPSAKRERNDDDGASTESGGLPPELLSLLLELRAELAAMREQVVARLVRLDQRVARMERSRANGASENSPPMGCGGTAARRLVQVRTRQPRLDDLSADLLALVAAALPEDDELAAAHSCRKLRAAVAHSSLSAMRRGGRTAARTALSSRAKLEWSVSCGLALSPRLCELAAEVGQLLQLSFLRSRGCPWDVRTFRNAAMGGHLAVLRWVRANGCPWDAQTCTEAAHGGQLAVLQWARANGCPWTEETCSRAAQGSRLTVLQWARANGCPWTEETCSRAAEGGQLAVLQWARANGCPWDAWTCSRAAFAGQLAALQWARANGCPWDEGTCKGAAEHGHLSVLQWARTNGCPWTEETCSRAAQGGQLAVLQWACANGCPWNEYTCSWAAGPLAALSCPRARLLSPRAAVGASPLQHSQLAALSCPRARLLSQQAHCTSGCPWNRQGLLATVDRTRHAETHAWIEAKPLLNHSRPPRCPAVGSRQQLRPLGERTGTW